MNIVYKLATRSRPNKALESVLNIRAMSLKRDPWIIVSIDVDDMTCNNPDFYSGLSFPNVYVVRGTSKNKIDAFNRDIPITGWDIIVATSDDIEFKHGMDLMIESDWKKLPVNEFDGERDAVLWYGDGAVHGQILTVPIMTKKYYTRLGYIYNPEYTSLFCDEEAIHVGENLGKIVYSQNDILVHNHPAWGKAEWDAQYRHTDGFYHADKIVYERRKALGFPLNS